MFNFIQFVFSLLFLVFIIRFLKNRPSGRSDISDINPNRDLRINKHSEIVPSDLRTVMDKTFRGNIFENRVKDYLLNNYNKLLVLTNCVFVENGKSCEVDLLVFTVQGLISIECKSFNGMVVGSLNKPNWTVYYSKEHKFEFLSPLLQNKYHIRRIKSLFGVHPNNLVVFDDCTKISDFLSHLYNVINFRNIDLYMKEFMLGPVIYTYDDLLEIYNRIKESSTDDLSSHIEYVNNLRVNV